MEVFLCEPPFREPCQWNPFAVNRRVYYYNAARARRARPGTRLPLEESTGQGGEQHSGKLNAGKEAKSPDGKATTVFHVPDCSLVPDRIQVKPSRRGDFALRNQWEPLFSVTPTPTAHCSIPDKKFVPSQIHAFALPVPDFMNGNK